MDIGKLKELLKEGVDFNLEMEEIGRLKEKIKRAEIWDEKC